jgi:hypothetical protein
LIALAILGFVSLAERTLTFGVIGASTPRLLPTPVLQAVSESAPYATRIFPLPIELTPEGAGA